MQLDTSLLDAVHIGAVHHEYQALSAGVVMSPQWTDLLLTTDILYRQNRQSKCSLMLKYHRLRYEMKLTFTYPYVEAHILVLDRFYVEANRWDRCYRLAEFEPIKDRRFASCVQTQHQDSHFLVPKFREKLPHLVVLRTHSDSSRERKTMHAARFFRISLNRHAPCDSLICRWP